LLKRVNSLRDGILSRRCGQCMAAVCGNSGCTCVPHDAEALFKPVRRADLRQHTVLRLRGEERGSAG